MGVCVGGDAAGLVREAWAEGGRGALAGRLAPSG